MALLLLGPAPTSSAIAVCADVCGMCPSLTTQLSASQRDALIDADISHEYPLAQTYIRSRLAELGCSSVAGAYQASGCCDDDTQPFSQVKDVIAEAVPGISSQDLAARHYFAKLQYLVFTMGRYSYWRSKHIIQSNYAGYWFQNQCKETSEAIPMFIGQEKTGTCGGDESNGDRWFTDGLSVPNYHESAIFYAIPNGVGDESVLGGRGAFLNHQKMNALVASLSAAHPLRTVHKVQKAWTYLRIANEHGPMPLIESFVYPCTTDCAPAVSDARLYQEAVTLLQDAADDVSDGTVPPLGELDQMFGGDMALWKKLANTLLLQTALRMYTNVDARCAAGDCGPFTKAQIEQMIQSSIQAGILVDRDAKMFGYLVPDSLLAGNLLSNLNYPTMGMLLTSVGTQVGGQTFMHGPFSKSLVNRLTGDARLSRYVYKAQPRDWVMSQDTYDLLLPDFPASSVAGRTSKTMYSGSIDTIPPTMSISQTRSEADTKLQQQVVNYIPERVFDVKWKWPVGAPQLDSSGQNQLRLLLCRPIWSTYGATVDDANCNIKVEIIQQFDPPEQEELGYCGTAYYRITETFPGDNAQVVGDVFTNVTVKDTMVGLPVTPPARYNTTVWDWNCCRSPDPENPLPPILMEEGDYVMRDTLEFSKQFIERWHFREAWRSGRGFASREWISWAGNEELATSCMELPEVIAHHGLKIDITSPVALSEPLQVGPITFDSQVEWTVPIPDDTYIGIPPRNNIVMTPSTTMGFSRLGPEMWNVDFPWGTRLPTPEESSASSFHYFITAAEANLLLAEATAYGLTSAHGTAESLVQTGMQHSYDQFRAQGTAPTPDYTGLATLDKLSLIWQQKWLAVFPDVTSAWTIIRETGVPHELYQVPDGPFSHMGNTNGRVPQRLAYPASPAFQTELAGFVNSRNSPLWWSKTAVDPTWNVTFVDSLEPGLTQRVLPGDGRRMSESPRKKKAPSATAHVDEVEQWEHHQ